MSDILELELRDTPTGVGVSREDINRLAETLETTPEMIIHMAISRMLRDIFYDEDPEGPSDEEIARREKLASEMGEAVTVDSLADRLGITPKPQQEG